MSGELVGEVIAAAADLKARGLSERGFHALIAIAEKCYAHSRQGSVPWSHIRAGLFGTSKRTAERAVGDLKGVGVLRVVRPGFNNNHGRMCAPIYEIAPLTDTDTQVSSSLPTDTDTQVTQSVPTDTDKPGGRYRQNGDRYRHPGVVLNGSINGSINGHARASDDARAAPDDPDAPKPPCPWCRDTGVVLNADGKPGRRLLRLCHHDSSWHAMTDDEITEHAELLEALNKGVA